MIFCNQGANSHGQLGIKRFSEYELPTRVENVPSDIKAITAGAGHTIILENSGDLWATGWNNKGQLGIGSTINTSSFIKLDFNHKLRSVSCGWDTSGAITNDNRLFVWGSNSQNQLGFSNKEKKIVTKPVELKLPFGDRVVDIKFGLRHSAILAASNNIFIIGSSKHFKNVKHQIINHNSTEYLHIIPESKIHQIASGQNHISMLDERNSIHGLGDNKFMQCSDVKHDGKITRLTAGWTHNAYLTETKELYLYGRNNYGQIGNGRRSDFEAPHKCEIHPVDAFQLGAEHGILKSNDDVYTWGWNEHGNCGNGSVDDV